MSAALLQTITALIVVIMGSVVAVGQFLLMRQKGWREAAESSGALVTALQAQLEEATKERHELEEKLEQAVRKHATDIQLLEAKHNADIKLMEARMITWEAQLAQAQRINHILQQKLDAAEARHAAIDARQEARNLRQHPIEEER